MKEVKEIKFNNLKNPNSQFDIIELRELLSRTELDHDLTVIHRVEFYHIFFVIEGTGKHTIDFTDYEFKKGTLFTLRKNQLQKFSKDYNANGYLLIFTEDFLISHFNQIEISKSIQLFNNLLIMPKIELNSEEFDDLMELVNRIKTEYFEAYDDFSGGIIRSALHMIITKLFRIKTKNSDHLLHKKYFNEFVQFQQLVEQHYADTKKVADYASKMNCSSKTLNNICNNIIGKSAKVVIHEVVITQIKRLLISTNLSVTEIAYTVGFEEPSNLYKYFKLHSGTTPELFRKSS
ncbi:AraC family transcriptional regulator, transcriptional activator of pobA [Tenacibaculum sp. 190524A05c]|uniref:AraC family transcriptional regulator n=1 Tax=Tenacibaculum platacis TaxID=3137852 RepID=UPI0031FA5CDD